MNNNLYDAARNGQCNDKCRLLKSLLRQPRYQSRQPLKEVDFNRTFGENSRIIGYPLYYFYKHPSFHDFMETLLIDKNQHLSLECLRRAKSAYKKNPCACRMVFEQMTDAFPVRPRRSQIVDWVFNAIYEEEFGDIQEAEIIRKLKIIKVKEEVILDYCLANGVDMNAAQRAWIE
ncbi:unnamed protein product [Caenorhabditis angaria]|uniref:Uncharacterized protein n=1 Tax=Caenorhabditis angaria TaxID=860376 RepID=A0A9P1IJY6_9PELO|nr:unnamed protein product [Caenorhabditis angaria]